MQITLVDLKLCAYKLSTEHQTDFEEIVYNQSKFWENVCDIKKLLVLLDNSCGDEEKIYD